MEARENKTDELFSSVSPHLSLMSLVSPLLSTLFFNFSVSHVSCFPPFRLYFPLFTQTSASGQGKPRK